VLRVVGFVAPDLQCSFPTFSRTVGFGGDAGLFLEETGEVVNLETAVELPEHEEIGVYEYV